ncbi:MAG: DUF2007 domain-containing protein [Alphaproteobacteria bacterium]|jgi:hypothetical protein|nr:DUF2007 domain-containing protein [Rhodospirillaceae bacterium]MDG2481334.1 DUF2007 domain-containing protein [Alphaproteobacteria bacterium]MBT6203086.1 DUF2007 domain-containing protein [Rhodospirillaceae bacterium]MBT6510104.1 DUF2007 domain-containing protein [Rhodospirillaceae bacterium]MBT7614754.1 DUF2007 domain-containing protein [Rhodospirillaceae bacterium]
MKEILRTNDLVTISFARALLDDAGIANEVFDQHTSAIEGGVWAIQRRVLVLDEDVDEAVEILTQADMDVRRP